MSAGFVGIFIPCFDLAGYAQRQQACGFQEILMTRLYLSEFFIPQGLRYTLRSRSIERCNQS
jgi:hypothetical protein